MLWPIMVAGGVGLLLGLLFVRVHLLVAASLAFVLVYGIVGSLAQWSVAGTIAVMFTHVATLQVSYFGGVLFSSACARAKTPAPGEQQNGATYPPPSAEQSRPAHESNHA